MGWGVYAVFVSGSDEEVSFVYMTVSYFEC
jgi:hypothetical protein